MATVVATRGSTYRRPGARLLISPSGWIAGSISGGCIEAELQGTAWKRTENGPVLETFDATSEGDAIWGYGLGCAGAVDVLLERPSLENPAMSLLAKCVFDRQPVSVAYDLTPGPTLGSIYVEGGGTRAGLELLARALDYVDSTKPTIVHDGERAVYVERVPAGFRLVIFGAGNDAIPLVRIATEVGWSVIVVDRRPNYATSDRFPTADAVYTAPPEEMANQASLDANAYCVLMSHNYLSDLAVLRELGSTATPYIGVLGPRIRTEKLLSEIDDASSISARVHGPIGLDIGAEGPESIALAIVAEIQAISASRPLGLSPVRSQK